MLIRIIKSHVVTRTAARTRAKKDLSEVDFEGLSEGDAAGHLYSGRRLCALRSDPLQPRPAGADGVCGVGCLATGIERGARPADGEISRGP